MKTLKIKNSNLEVSEIALGCMRISSLSQSEAEALLGAAIDSGINFFDHADIYGQGRSEEVFGNTISPSTREKIIIQTKCGIRKGFFDFSKEHIISSVEGSLKRLKTDYVDALLLHRPDTLMEPEEVAEAFSQLESSGKVRYFGVSNQNPMQIQLLSKFVKQPLLFNQLQLSVMATGMIDAGFNVNINNSPAINRDGGVLEFCRLNDITIQPWSPFMYGFFEGIFIGNEKFPELNETLEKIAGIHGVSPSAMAIAWILRHPAKMQPIIGTTKSSRVRDIVKASDMVLTREQWYEIYRAAGNKMP